MTYTTQALVAGEVGVDNTTITAASIPSTTDISNWISEAKAEIDWWTGKVWESTSISSTTWEYYDYNGSSNGTLILNNKPVLSVEVVQTEVNGVGATASSWVTLTNGRTNADNFELSLNEGLLRFHQSTNGYKPMPGSRSIRVAYTYGYSTVPLLVQRLATLIVAERYIKALANQVSTQTGLTITVGAVKVTDPGLFSLGRLRDIKEEKVRLYAQLGRLKTFAPTYEWSN